MKDKEFDAVIKLSAKKRYEYFIKKVADAEEVWGLFQDGWATTEDGCGNILVPFWPKKKFAEYCAIEGWECHVPKRIELDKFIDEWLPGMKKDGTRPSIFWNNIDSAVVEINILLNDLTSELDNY
ncbi:MAG: DUF2750 domain-containing protein [Spirochaetes bacterium]|nr:DUF2750 domain-containing protein [Spirochaetota bacterium]